MGRVWPWVIGVVVVVVGIVLMDPVLPYDADKVHVTVRELEEPFVDILTQDDESQLTLRITDSAKTVRWFWFDLETAPDFGSLWTNTNADPEWREVGADEVDATRLRLCEILRDYDHLGKNLAETEARMRGSVRERIGAAGREAGEALLK